MASSGLAGCSGVGSGATGGLRTTRLCSRATGKEGHESFSRLALIRGTPQRNTNTLSSIHGVHAARILGGAYSALVVGRGTPCAPGSSPTGCFWVVGGWSAGTECLALPSLAGGASSVGEASSLWVHSFFGCQTRSSTVVAAMEQIEATMSTSQGPWKFAIRNCGTAKAMPAV